MANRTGGAAYPGDGGGRAGNSDQGSGSLNGGRPNRNRNRNRQNNNRGHGGDQHPNRNRNRGNGQNSTPMGHGPLNALSYDAPLDYPTAVKLAKALGGLQYDSQIGQLKGIQSNIPSYFDQYRAAITNAQGQTNQLSQPLLTQAGQVAQNTGQTLGLTGPAAANDQLAAASRQQQAGEMAQALQGIANANSNFYTQTGQNSYGAQATANQQLGQQIAGLKGERGNAILNNLLNLRENDRNYNLEVKTLLDNQANDRAQARNTRAGIRATNRRAANDFLAKNGVSQKTWRHMTPKERVAWKREWNRSQQSPGDKLNTARLKYFRQHGYFPPTGPGGGSNGKDQYGNTPRQQRAANSAWTKARATAGTLSKPYTDKSGFHPAPTNWREVYRNLVTSGSGVNTTDSDILKVAAMRVTKTHIPKSLMDSLRRQGVDVAQIRNPKGNRNPYPGKSTTGGRPDTAGNPGVGS